MTPRRPDTFRLLAAMAFALLLGAFTPAGAQMVDLKAGIDSIDQANRYLDVAHAAFMRGEYVEARDIYVKVAESGYSSASVWFNAGAAAHRAEHRGQAVLFFRRALRVDPSYDRALGALDLVSPQTNDGDTGFISQVAGSLFRSTSPTLWVVLAEIAFLLACLGIAFAMRTTDRDRRGHWVAVLCWSLVLAAGFAAIGTANYQFRVGGDEAVILTDKTITRAAPDEGATAQLELPAGTVVSLLEEPRRGFVRVKMADGRSGYVSTSEVERI